MGPPNLKYGCHESEHPSNRLCAPCCRTQDFVPSARLDVNDKLRIASMWCGPCYFRLSHKPALCVFPMYALKCWQLSDGVLWMRPRAFLITMCVPISASLIYRHSLHAIASQLSPVPGCTGIQASRMDVICMHRHSRTALLHPLRFTYSASNTRVEGQQGR